MMSLYDDLNDTPEAEEPKPESRGWPQSQSLTLLQEHCLHVKRLNAKRSERKPKHSKPNPPLEATPIAHFALAYGEEASKASQRGSLLGGDWNLGDEYDPLWPNDYETTQKRAESQSKSLIGLDYDSNDESEESEQRGAQIAPPASLLDTSGGGLEEYGGVSSVAKNIMKRMGFKSGSGLGRDEQGMARALHVEQHVVGKRAAMGVIVREEKREEPIDDVEITEEVKKPSKRVVLKNLVAKGEIDEELEEEVKEECLKYGEVVKVTIQDQEEAVLVMVEFSRVESAIKAVVDLNGRFFGGRSVRATFHST